MLSWQQILNEVYNMCIILLINNFFLIIISFFRFKNNSRLSTILSKIYFGRSPQNLPPGSITLFPYYSNRLFCGLVGFLEFKRHNTDFDIEASIKSINKRVDEIKKNNLKEVISSSIDQNSYLGGKDNVLDLKSFACSLKTLDAFEAIFKDQGLQNDLGKISKELKKFIANEEETLKKEGIKLSSLHLEAVNQNLIILKDIAWWFEKEILSDVIKVSDLIKSHKITSGLIRSMKKINIMLNNLDRLEVRGRDSAGISVMVNLPDAQVYKKYQISLTAQGLNDEFKQRQKITHFCNRSITLNTIYDSVRLSFIYKTAQVIGRLGENVSKLRKFITEDQLLFDLLSLSESQCQVIAHTRWASVGEISEENCHPINNEGSKSKFQIQAVLNGDIDNYIDLKERLYKEEGVEIDKKITTDTKIIPLWVEHYFNLGNSFSDAFRLAVNDFEGSHAIALFSDLDPHRLYLAQRGSGQTIFIGLCQDSYLVASEVYGFVDQASSYIKLDGEKERVSGDAKTKGQIFILDEAGGKEGISACYYDGNPINLSSDSISEAEITTRDIDRGNYPHYFLKEISQAPNSVQNTLKGRVQVIIDSEKREKKAVFNLGSEIIPSNLRNAFNSAQIKYIYLIGQGTAGVAAEGIALLLREYLSPMPISIMEKKASELSGFGIDRPLNDTLVIAVTQSGTTTDTNKAVDLAKANGAYTISIVNRRNSDITYKTEGKFYTSDGRDIEMSVASTKAFYSQIIAGCILGLRFAQILETKSEAYIAAEIQSIYRLPKLMNQIIKKEKDAIEISAKNLSLQKKYWAIVGSGPNKVAANEVRIKLSELCYKTLPADVVEDRKHIDLSAEPLIIVCAAGNRETVLSDIIKDTAIFKAHKAKVVCIVDESEERFNTIADSILRVPYFNNERLSPILNTMIGHLWGYYAAVAINELADFFKDLRGKLIDRMNILQSEGKNQMEIVLDPDVRDLVINFEQKILSYKTKGYLNGVISADTISDLILAIKYALGHLPLIEISADFGHLDNFYDCLSVLLQVLDKAINEFSRPIDAIKHQAKTVTVGTSRLPEAISGPIFDYLVKHSFFNVVQCDFPIIQTLKSIQPVVDSIKGLTAYEVNKLDQIGRPTPISTIRVLTKEGIAQGISSRAEKDPSLRGTKRIVIKNNEVYIGVGLMDGAQIIIFPIHKADRSATDRYLIVMHLVYKEKDVTLMEKIAAMGDKYELLVIGFAEELNIDWDDSMLDDFNISFLMSKQPKEIIDKILERNKEK